MLDVRVECASAVAVAVRVGTEGEAVLLQHTAGRAGHRRLLGHIQTFDGAREHLDLNQQAQLRVAQGNVGSSSGGVGVVGVSAGQEVGQVGDGEGKRLIHAGFNATKRIERGLKCAFEQYAERKSN